MQQVMKHHEDDGLGRFAYDPEMAQTTGIHCWKAPCGCAVMIPTTGDDLPSFVASREHHDWCGAIRRSERTSKRWALHSNE